MNWSAIQENNRRLSGRKARRERAEAATKAKVKSLGGMVKVAEVRAATFRVEAVERSHGGIKDWVVRLVLPNGQTETIAALMPVNGDLRNWEPTAIYAQEQYSFAGRPTNVATHAELVWLGWYAAELYGEQLCREPREYE